jgi:glycosyltransferase involved in cell wall biosynthesis
MVSKALVVSAYRRKLEELARCPGMELTAIVPPGWQGRADSAPLEHEPVEGYRLLIEPVVLNGHHHLHFYPGLEGRLRALQPEILHMDEEPYNLATWRGLRAGQAVRARCLFFTWQNLSRRYPWPFSHFERANYARAAHAIAGSTAAASLLRAKGYRGPVTVIPQFGIDPEVFGPAGAPTPSTPARAGSPCDFVIGYAGRLVPEKGVDLLLRACAALPLRVWSLRIMGDGPERSRLTGLAGSLGIAGKVTFLGRRPSIEAPEFYRSLDVLVLPSVTRPNWTEQFGRVLVEAMACRVPVIGSVSGEIPAVIGDAGLLFPEGDVPALADRIACLAADPARRAVLAEQGRARALSQYTNARIAEQTIRVYEEMLNDTR